VREPGLEVCDDLLDDGVLAMLGIDDRDVLGAVGDQGEVPSVGKQFGLGAEQAGSADHQPALAIRGLGDLRLPAGGVVNVLPGALVDRVDRGADLLMLRTPIEYCQPVFSRYSNTLVFQNPESRAAALAAAAGLCRGEEDAGRDSRRPYTLPVAQRA